MTIDGRQMVSLISVHGRGSLSEEYGLLHFSLVPVGFKGQYFYVLLGNWVSCGPAMISYSYWYIQVFFKSLAVTRDVIDCSTLVFFRCFVFKVYYHRAEGVRRLVIHVHVM